MATNSGNFRKYCSVNGCLNNSITNQGFSWFSLPQEQERRMKWLQLIDRQDLMTKNAHYYHVCEVHFNAQDICQKPFRKVLKKDVLPCLHLPYRRKHDKEMQTDLNTSDCFTQTQITEIDLMTPSSGSSCKTVMITNTSDAIVQTAASLSADTPRKRKMKSVLKGCTKRLRVQESELKSQTSSKDMFHKLCDRLLTKDLAELVKQKGNRNSHAYKMFCLNLYYISPQAYSLLQNTIGLPCISTINKLYKPMTTEINDELMAALKMKADNMSEREKQCSLVMGLMSLKTNLFYDIKNDKIIGFHEVQGVQSPSPAKLALTVVIRGIFVKWYQPIGFSLLSECSNDDNISLWIDKIISKLFEIGLKVRVCVSDLGSDSLKASEKRGISVNKTYFTVDNHKIYYIFDAPHLIKLTRNNLMTYDFHFQNDSVAKYEHIVQFYEHDKIKDYKQAHKLTNSHINPTNFEKIKVQYATQLLSRSVASGLSTYIDFELIDESARATVKFIQMMNDLFDILNSSNCRDKFYKSAFSGTEHQKDFFNNMLTIFQTLKLRNPKNGEDVTKTVKFIKGFEITIKSIQQLHEDLKEEGYSYLLTRCLNQDVIKNFFSKIRSKNGMATEPSSRHFISAFRKIFFAALTRAPKEGNCREDLTEFLVHLRDHKVDDESKGSSIDLDINNDDRASENTLHEIVRSDYVQVDTPEEKSFFYVCGTLLKKCLDRHNNCELLKSYLEENQLDCNYSAESRSLHYEDFSSNRNSFIVPPDDFVKNIERMEHVFRKSFENNHLNLKIGQSIYEQLKNIEFTLPCPCFPKIFLQKLFVRMRIYFTLTSNNKAFRTCRNRRIFFSVTDL